jgi:hypothetical protein
LRWIQQWLRTRKRTVLISYLDRNLIKTLEQIKNNSAYSLQATAHQHIFGFLCNTEETRWENQATMMGEMSPTCVLHLPQ